MEGVTNSIELTETYGGKKKKVAIDKVFKAKSMLKENEIPKEVLKLFEGGKDDND